MRLKKPANVLKNNASLLYPLILPIIPLLAFYQQNTGWSARGFQADVFLQISIVVVISCWLFSLALTKSRQKASLLSFGLIVCFYTFNSLQKLAEAITNSLPRDIRPLILITLISLISINTWLVIKNLPSEMVVKINKIVLRTTVILLIFMTGLSTMQYFFTPNTSYINSTAQKGDKNLPDVYYIILDAYGRSDQLSSRFNYDNSSFINALKQKKFYVADKAHSNYAHTFWSLPATLNLKYLNNLTKQVGEESVDRSPLRDLLLQHKAAGIFKSLGYKYIQIGSNWNWTNENPQSDITLPDKNGLEHKFFGNSISKTTSKYLKKTAAGSFLKTEKRGELANKILGAFEKTKKIPEIDAPTFSFVHIVSPHPPYIFNEDGLIQGLSQKDFDTHGFSDKKLFVAQTKYVNILAIDMIETILYKSQTPPIIIIASDHGPASSLTRSQLQESDVQKLNTAAVKERMGILSAFYFPDQNYSKLYPTISPVNHLRLVLTQYFGLPKPLLKDKSYFSDNKLNEYRLHDVTKLLQ